MHGQRDVHLVDDCDLQPITLVCLTCNPSPKVMMIQIIRVGVRISLLGRNSFPLGTHLNQGSRYLVINSENGPKKAIQGGHSFCDVESISPECRVGSDAEVRLQDVFLRVGRACQGCMVILIMVQGRAAGDGNQGADEPDNWQNV